MNSPYWPDIKKWEIFFTRSVLIKGQEIGEKILFPVWIILFPVLKAGFGIPGKNEELFVKQVF